MPKDTVNARSTQYEIALSHKVLADIVNNKFKELILDIDADQYNELSEGNKKALYYLIKAGRILDSAFLEQDHPENKAVAAFLEEQAAGQRANGKAHMALKLYKAWNGLEGIDMYAAKSKPLRLIKGKKLTDGKGFYPADITEKELKAHLLAHPAQASAFLGNNTVVRRKEDGSLHALPYSQAWPEEMNGAAEALLEASYHTDHKGLAKYLRLQAQALVNDADPEIMYKADKAWIELEDSPLEFTIARECYTDTLSAKIVTDPDVKAMLDKYGIIAKSKDTLGTRVGIVNQDSVQTLQMYRNELDGFAKQMPLYAQYRHQKSEEADPPMTFADVDLVDLTGDYRAFRGGITLAQNLPNDDKLASQLGAGSRLVFHRTVRTSGDPEATQRNLEALLAEDQHDLYDKGIDFEFTIGHEMVHSLGPSKTLDGRDKKTALGVWGSVIEENKADLGSAVMAEAMVKTGALTREQADKIYVTWAMDDLPAKQPKSDEAHRFRSIMQHNYLREHGAIELERGGKLRVHVDKVPEVARKMLTEVVSLQLEGDAEKAEAFATKYGAWNDELAYVVEVKNSLPSKRYGIVESPFADKILDAGPQT